MDADSSGTESTPVKEAIPRKSAGPPPIVFMSAAIFIQLQRQLKGVAKQSFKLRNTRSGTRVLTKDLIYIQAVKAHLEENNLCYFRFYPKSEKPPRHLPYNTPTEDIADGLLGLGFDVISVKQMTTTHRSPAEEPTPVQCPLTLFLITLPSPLSLKNSASLQASATLQLRWRLIERKIHLHNAITSKSLVTSW
jgi:hypothetical protein